MAFRMAAGSDDPRAGLWLVEGTIARQTEKALLLVLHGGAWRAWLPRRKVIVTALADGRVEVALPEWLAQDKGLI